MATISAVVRPLPGTAADPEDPHLDGVRVVVDVDVDESRVSGARVRFEGGGAVEELVTAALADSTVLAALRSGFPVEVLPA